MGISRERIWIFVLAILLVVAAVYIGISKYRESKAERDFGLVQQGAQIGYEQAVVDLMKQASTCEQVPLYYNNGTANFTISIIAVDCLQQAPQSLNKSK